MGKYRRKYGNKNLYCGENNIIKSTITFENEEFANIIAINKSEYKIFYEQSK